MLDVKGLAWLIDAVGDAAVLTIYLSAEDRDPAQRQAWRLRLAASIEAARTDVPEHELEGFDAAHRLVETELRKVPGFLPGPGWCAFATAGRVLFSGSLPAPVPDTVRWRYGPLLGPALPALTRQWPAVLALVDSRRARIFRYAGGELEEVVDLRADTYIDDLGDRNTSKRAAVRSGVRGETATDAADRILRQQTMQMLGDVAPLVRGLAGPAGAILLGGPEEARAALRHLLADLPGENIDGDVALPVLASAPEVRAAIELHASRLAETRLQRLVARVVDDARAGGRGAVGLHAARRAVENGQVAQLFVTPVFAERHEADVEPLLARCLTLGGDLEAVTGAAAALLDGEGIAARLRFIPT
jgi:hypothetical protein